MAYWDAKFILLKSLPNVLITPHSAFLTQEALTAICNTTITNVEEYVGTKPLTNVVKPKAKAAPKSNPKAFSKRVSVNFTAPIEAPTATSPSGDVAVAQPVVTN